jgi:hypothetical protein
MNWSLVPLTTPQGQIPALVTAAGARASMRFLEFFAANIRNARTRREPQWTARGKLRYRLEISAEPQRGSGRRASGRASGDPVFGCLQHLSLELVAMIDQSGNSRACEVRVR